MKTFTVSNYKGVREIELTPNGNLTVIAGGNGAGKSSLIDAITELFDPRGTKLTPKPIRDGEKEARAEFTDDELGIRIIRVWKKDGTPGTLSAEALDGAQYKRPTDVVAKLTGGAIFDPLAWLNMDEKKQREELLSKVDLPFDLADLTEQKARVEERRRDIGRTVKRLQGALESTPNADSDVPDEEVSAQSIIDQIQTAQDAARDREVVTRRERDALALVDRLTAELVAAQDALAAARQDVRLLPTVASDIDALRSELSHVDEINQQVRAKQERARVTRELADSEAAHAAAQAELDNIEQQKRDGLTAAKFPLDGLSVAEDGITYEGIPFSQVNSAHRMRAAFGIATAGEPDLKLVIVKNGDLLDADSLNVLAGIAEERGYTALVERDRDESRSIGFVIRDGVLAD